MSTEEDRYARLADRERLLVDQIRMIQERYMSETEPLADELFRLREHRDPKTITAADGRTFIYTGPRPDYKLPEERDGN